MIGAGFRGGSRPRSRLAIWLLLCWPAWAVAHISGYTDTSVQIAATGIRIIYTLPSDSLMELESGRGGDDQTVGPPERYLAAVRDGWTVESAGERCLLTQARARALDTLPSYQYQFSYVCPSGLDTLNLRYALFFGQWPEHENFVRMFMADQRQRLRFTAERQSLSVPVAELLSRWGKPLAKGFFGADPNRGLQAGLNGTEGEPPRVLEPSPSLGGLSLAETDPGFIRLGLEHIFAGLDHVLFVVGLVLVTRSWRRLLALVTAFTLAHSVTLGLATLGLIDFRPAVTEPLIALTIVYIGLENLWTLRRSVPGTDSRSLAALLLRAGLVFGFGLIHGVGFSYVLREMGLREDLLGSLLYFNLGVELGQLAIIAAALPLVLLGRCLAWGERLALGASTAVAFAGAVMFVGRL